MMFWFKPRKVYVDCFTTSERVYNQYFPEKAAAFIPEWWKKLPKFVEERVWPLKKHTRPYATMRTCTGFRDLYFTGFIIPLWSDLKLTVDEHSYYYSFGNESSEIKQHPVRQYGNNYPNYHHMKLISPWVLKEKTGVKFFFTEPTWAFLESNLDIRVLPGILQYNLNTQTNVNIFAPKKEQSIFLEAGYPMVHLIPLTDKKLVIKKHVVSQQEMVNIHDPPAHVKFYNDYENYKKFMEKNK